MRWQIISLLHSLVLAPALTLHSHTFTLCEGHAGHKLYEQPLDVQGCCAVHQHILTVTGIGYYLINVQDKKPYTTGQKLMAQKLKDRRMMNRFFQRFQSILPPDTQQNHFTHCSEVDLLPSLQQSEETR